MSKNSLSRFILRFRHNFNNKEQKYGVSLEFFKKHQKEIVRAIGALLLIVGFVINFWVTPQKGLSKNQIAAANIARMEVKVASNTNSASSKRR